jgi:hypothetical protein
MPRPGKKCLADCGSFFESIAEPGPGVLPVPVGDGSREPHGLACLVDREPTEEVELSHLSRGGVFLPEPSEQFVEREDEIGVLGDGTNLVEKLDSRSTSRSLQPLTIASVVDEDAPHRLGRGGEEVASAIKVLVTDEPEVSLVDEGRAI